MPDLGVAAVADDPGASKIMIETETARGSRDRGLGCGPLLQVGAHVREREALPKLFHVIGIYEGYT